MNNKQMKVRCQTWLGRGLKNFTILDWSLIRPNSNNEIEYSVEHLTEDLPVGREFFGEISKAWSHAFSNVSIPITFKEVSGIGSIRHCFAINGDPNLPYQFEANVLAYALPDGRIFYNKSFLLDLYSSQGIGVIFDTGVHEIGHTLGLGHTNVSGDIMQAYSGSNLKITYDSENAILERYYEYVVDTELPTTPTTPTDTEEEDNENKYKVALVNLFSNQKEVLKLKEPTLLKVLEDLTGKEYSDRLTKKDEYKLINKELNPKNFIKDNLWESLER